MTELPVKILDKYPDGTLQYSTGRDLRLVEEEDDRDLDLELYQWGLEHGHNYTEALSVCLRQILTEWVSDDPDFRGDVYNLKNIMPGQTLLSHGNQILFHLPLKRMGFKNFNHALRWCVQRFLRKQETK